jgi:hypothetical protein
MKRTRWMLVATLVLLVGGIGFALIGAYGRLAVQASASNIPGIVAYLPKDANIVAYIDVRKLVYSPAYQAFEKDHGDEFTTHLQEFIAETGLDPRSDIDAVAFASRSGSGINLPVAIVAGNYQDKQAKLETLITTKGQAAVSQYGSHKLFTNPKRTAEDPHQETAAFLDGSKLVFGHLESVKATIDAFDTKAANGILTNPEFNQLISQTRTDGTFWLVSTNMSFIDHFKKQAAGAPEQLQQNIPKIQNLILEADLGNIVTASLRSQCTDENMALNLGNFVKGLVALGNMLTSQQPELAGVLQGVTVTQTNKMVEVNFSVPFETLRSLQQMEVAKKVEKAKAAAKVVKTF